MITSILPGWFRYSAKEIAPDDEFERQESLIKAFRPAKGIYFKDLMPTVFSVPFSKLFKAKSRVVEFNHRSDFDFAFSPHQEEASYLDPIDCGILNLTFKL